jgi:hypothetical protein
MHAQGVSSPSVVVQSPIITPGVLQDEPQTKAPPPLLPELLLPPELQNQVPGLSQVHVSAFNEQTAPTT